MTKYIIPLFFILFLETPFAQNFFPLRKGNKFQYRSEYYQTWPGGSASGVKWYKTEVIDDTVINGQMFHKLDGAAEFFWPGFGYNDNQLFYYDSLDNKLFVKIEGDDSVRLGVDFNMSEDSIFISYLFGSAVQVITRGTYVDTIFNTEIKNFKLEYFSGDHNRYFTFGQNFGIDHFHLYAYEMGWGISVFDDTLYSAIIDTNIYNPLTIHITDISPITNRPIDAFPFVLHGSYTASVPDLIDSFYVIVLLSRNNQTIFSQQLEFSNGQINIPIQPNMLEVGDIIKIRATLTDESIFSNIIHYPDSGWSEILVLPPVSTIKSYESVLEYKLDQNFPNPFNPSTNIRYSIPSDEFVTLKVFNILGSEVTTLVSEKQARGEYTVNFNASQFPSGIYYYTIKAGSFSETRKMMLLK